MKNETTATMATEAAKRAVENAGIKPEELMLLWFLQYLLI